MTMDRPKNPGLPAIVASVKQAEARVMERDRMLRWRIARLRTDARVKWNQERGRALAVGGGLVAGLLMLAVSRRRGRRHTAPLRHARAATSSLWLRWLPVGVSLAVPFMEPALRRRLGGRVTAWLMALLLAWRPGARRGRR